MFNNSMEKCVFLCERMWAWAWGDVKVDEAKEDVNDEENFQNVHVYSQ